MGKETDTMRTYFVHCVEPTGTPATIARSCRVIDGRWHTATTSRTDASYAVAAIRAANAQDALARYATRLDAR